MAFNSALMMAITRDSFARMSSKSLMTFEQFLVFGLDLVNFQPGQLIQAQFQNRVHLPLGQRVTACLQARFAADQNAPASRPASCVHSNASSLTRASSRFWLERMMCDELVQVRQRDEITFQQFGAFLGLASVQSACGAK